MCHKINYKCAKCGELVAKQDREEHDEECGTQIKAKDVGQIDPVVQNFVDVPLNQEMSEEEINKANEAEIQRIMAEEFAQELDEQEGKNRPLTNYEKSKLRTKELREKYGHDADLWPEGVRPADNAKIQSLIGGPDNDESFGNQDYEGNVFEDADEGIATGFA